MTDIQGRCPACRATSLFIGTGGHVTCSRIECPNPSAADELLHGEQPAPVPGDMAATQATERQARYRTCRECGAIVHYLNMVIHMREQHPQPDEEPKPEGTCRPVEVDGETIRVRGTGEFTDREREFAAEIVRAAKRKYAAEHSQPHDAGLSRADEDEAAHAYEQAVARAESSGPHPAPAATEATSAPSSLREQIATALRARLAKVHAPCAHLEPEDIVDYIGCTEYDLADAAIGALEQHLDTGEEQAWCKTCRRVWEGRSHRCESDAEQALTRVRDLCAMTIAYSVRVHAVDQARDTLQILETALGQTQEQP